MLVLGDLVIRVHERGRVTRDANIRNGDDSGIWVSQNLVIFRFRISKIPKFQTFFFYFDGSNGVRAVSFCRVLNATVSCCIGI